MPTIKFVSLDHDNEKLYSISKSIPNNWTIQMVIDFLLSKKFILPNASTSKNLLVKYGNGGDGDCLDNYEDYDDEFGICVSSCYSILNKTIEEYEWKDNDIIICSREYFVDLSLPEIDMKIIKGIGGADCDITVPTDVTVGDIIGKLINVGFLSSSQEWILRSRDGYVKDKYREPQILDSSDCRMLKDYEEGIRHQYVAEPKQLRRSGVRTKCLEQDLKDMTILARHCHAIKFKTLDSGNAPQKYEVSFYLRTIIGIENDIPIYREATIPSVFIFDLSNYPFNPFIKTTSISPPAPFHPCFNEAGQFDFSKSDLCFGGVPLAMHVIKVAKALQFEYISLSSFNRDAKNWIENHKYVTIFPCDKTFIPDYSDIIIKWKNYYWLRYLRRGY